MMGTLDSKKMLFARIRESLRDWPQMRSVEKGHPEVATKCRLLSASLYDYLQQPEHRIDGLSLAVVDASGYAADHAWLIAFHEDAGFFMVDPTASQFICRKGSKGWDRPYRDVFIGTYEELENMLVKSQEWETTQNFYTLWPPSMTLMPHPKDSQKLLHSPEEVAKLWKRYPYPLEAEILKDDALLGRWAARMEEIGADWYEALTSLRGQHPDERPDHQTLMQTGFFQNILKERNRFIQLGNDKDEVPFTEKIGTSYQSRTR